MKSALTLTKVRAMVRLYRAEIDGAAEHLEAVMRGRWDELHPLLRIAPHEIVRIVEREDAVQTLARVVEEAAAASARTRSIAMGNAARCAASALAKAATTHDGRTYQLPVSALRAALEAWRGTGDIAFGARGVVEVARLRALVRQCARLDSTNIALTNHELRIFYRTARSRGAIRLLLRARRDHDKLLVVPIPVLADSTADASAIYAPVPWPVDDATGASSPQPLQPPVRPVVALVG